jgi:hypothetical protein
MEGSFLSDATDENRPTQRTKLSSQAEQGGGLPSAVRAQERYNLAGHELEIEISDNGSFAVAEAHRVDVNH